ncbi:HNH endonuclease signature motif containing protein [Serratia rubidaea]|uniref:HNH endonuclease signature motif containing protein n=1 Tax=Serratia rubidaea TaxID=61652 RepID=UPI00242CCC2C|nr:HNH endonuclease signature motif containing protein [Serratia rubidaea]MCR1000134.1 HNH endonuclease [Serratia rubidaea]
MKKLPGNLYHLFYDELPPARYDRIINPRAAWYEVCQHYVLDTGSSCGFNMFGDDIQLRSRWDNRVLNDTGRYARKLKGDIECGNVVYIDDKEAWNSSRFAFYINEIGRLVSCGKFNFFVLNGSNRIIDYYEQAIWNRGEGPRPLPTVRSAEYCTPPQHAQAAKKQPGTLNSRAVGRLLAAGGVYNQNVEGFAQTAKQLGGDAAEGFTQVANPQSIGSLVALSSIVAVTRMPGGNIANIKSLEELQHFLGTYKGDKKLLNNIDVIKMDYIQRPRGELVALRSEFKNKAKGNFLRDIASHDEIVTRFDSVSRERMLKGLNPEGWEVHHKLPLDDSGTNSFDNLVLISKAPEHRVFTTAQYRVTKSLDESKTVLWPVPKGIVYP